MSYDVSALGAYTKQNAKNLIYKTIAQGRSIDLFEQMPDVKSAETVNIVATRGVWQTGGTCGFNASGSSTFSQRTLTVGKIKINLKWCEKDLEPKYLQGALKAGSAGFDAYNMLTFEEQIVGDISQNINKDLDLAIWQGDTTGGSAYLNKFDGLIKIIAAASPVTVSTVTWSVANSRTAIQNVLAGLTVDMLANPNIKIFMGTREAMDYRMKLGIDNLYHLTGSDAKLYAENSDVEIVPVLGLSGTKAVFAMATDNVFIGYDLVNEDTKFDLFYAKEADEIRFVTEFKYGVQVAFPDQIVYQANT